jgi:hypothetical protein
VNKFVSLIFTTILLLAGPSFGANKVGTAVIEGEIVELYSDYSWKFRSKEMLSNDSCNEITKIITFCGDTNWVRDNDGAADPSIAAQFAHKDRIAHSMIIEEPIGANQGLSEEFMLEAILHNAATGSGNNVEDIPILAAEDGSLKNRKIKKIATLMDFNGLQFVMVYSVFIGDNYNVQLITWHAGNTYDQTAKVYHADFVNLISISN